MAVIHHAPKPRNWTIDWLCRQRASTWISKSMSRFCNMCFLPVAALDTLQESGCSNCEYQDSVAFCSPAKGFTYQWFNGKPIGWQNNIKSQHPSKTHQRKGGVKYFAYLRGTYKLQTDRGLGPFGIGRSWPRLISARGFPKRKGQLDSFPILSAIVFFKNRPFPRGFVGGWKEGGSYP